MKNLQNSKTSSEVKVKAPYGSVGDNLDNQESEAPGAVSGSIQISNSHNQKVSREDIELVQNLIERCLQLYMSKAEVVRTLVNRARIDPAFTTLVWQKLEEENSEFFRAYYIRLKLKRQIIIFNHLLENQYHLMKYSMPRMVERASVHNVINPMPVNNPLLGYPALQQHLISTAVKAKDDPVKSAPFSYAVSGVPAPGNFHPIQINTINTNDDATGIAGPLPPSNDASSISEMPGSPPSVASSSHFSYMPPEIEGIDASVMDTTFTCNIKNSKGLDLDLGGAGCSKDPRGSLEQIPWNFSLADLTAEFENFEDFDALGSYMGSSFLLPSDSDVFLESPEPEDMVDECLMDDQAQVHPQL